MRHEVSWIVQSNGESDREAKEVKMISAQLGDDSLEEEADTLSSQSNRSAMDEDDREEPDGLSDDEGDRDEPGG